MPVYVSNIEALLRQESLADADSDNAEMFLVNGTYQYAVRVT